VMNENLGDLIMLIYKDLKTVMERELKKYDIGMGQMQILMFFFRDIESVFTQNELVKQLGVDKGNISRSIAKLLEKGYLEQLEDIKKKFRLSGKGVDLKVEIIPVLIRINNLITENIEHNDMSQALSTLLKVSEKLERII
jgi:DNA-binding MarR family transcriptional regulator